jgi:hypothetical protein
MPVRYDLKRTATGDIDLSATLLNTEPSDEIHISRCMSAFPGEYKQFLQNGVGIRAFQKVTGTRLLELDKLVKQQLQRDGYDVSKIKVTNTDNTLTTYIDATR